MRFSPVGANYGVLPAGPSVVHSSRAKRENTQPTLINPYPLHQNPSLPVTYPRPWRDPREVSGYACRVLQRSALVPSKTPKTFSLLRKHAICLPFSAQCAVSKAKNWHTACYVRRVDLPVTVANRAIRVPILSTTESTENTESPALAKKSYVYRIHPLLPPSVTSVSSVVKDSSVVESNGPGRSHSRRTQALALR